MIVETMIAIKKESGRYDRILLLFQAFPAKTLQPAGNSTQYLLQDHLLHVALAALLHHEHCRAAEVAAELDGACACGNVLLSNHLAHAVQERSLCRSGGRRNDGAHQARLHAYVHLGGGCGTNRGDSDGRCLATGSLGVGLDVGGGASNARCLDIRRRRVKACERIDGAIGLVQQNVVQVNGSEKLSCVNVDAPFEHFGFVRNVQRIG